MEKDGTSSSFDYYTIYTFYYFFWITAVITPEISFDVRCGRGRPRLRNGSKKKKRTTFKKK